MRNLRKERNGVVSSNKMDKTIVVAIKTKKMHPLYGKTVNYTSKLHAHDEKNEARKGDMVFIVETRPISKRKSFTLDRIEKRSVGSIELKEEVNAEVNDKADLDHDEEEIGLTGDVER